MVILYFFVSFIFFMLFNTFTMGIIPEGNDTSQIIITSMASLSAVIIACTKIICDRIKSKNNT